MFWDGLLTVSVDDYKLLKWTGRETRPQRDFMPDHDRAYGLNYPSAFVFS